MTRAPQKKTTIYDLARLAGTSASTVSAVLNGRWKERRISASTADRVSRLAEAQGYAVNIPASMLRRERSHMVGMIVPKYDNRYFGSIIEGFETRARDRGLFPVTTCTLRDPGLEIEAARTMISYQVDWLVATGATDPDRIADLCRAAGVRAVNLDLPGARAPSVISDNRGGALMLARRLLARSGGRAPMLFVGGRGQDHNTRARLEGFRAAHAERGIAVDERLVLTCGYSADKAEAALEAFAAGNRMPEAIFVNSTISLEGVVRWLRRRTAVGGAQPLIGCFDWDPFAAHLAAGIDMIRQDVPAMLDRVFALMDGAGDPPALIEVPPILVPAEEA